VGEFKFFRMRKGWFPQKRLQQDTDAADAPLAVVVDAPFDTLYPPIPCRRIDPGYTRAAGFYRFAERELKWLDRPTIPLSDVPEDVGHCCTGSPAVGVDGQFDGGLNVLLPQGTSANERIGMTIRIRSIEMRILVTKLKPEFATDAYHVFLMLDTQCNGQWPIYSDVFVHDVVGPGMGTDLFNLVNGSRFRILHHFAIPAPSAGIDNTVGPGFFMNVALQRSVVLACDIPIVYNGSTGAINEIRSNNLFLIYGCLYDSVQMEAACRIRYTDD